METRGIDLSANLGGAGSVACAIDWSVGAARVARPERKITDGRLAQLLSFGGPCGLDVPFGWPIGFVKTIVAHQANSALPVVPPPEDLAFRATDRYLRNEILKAAKWSPLSVSTDKLGSTALRAARVMADLSQTWPAGYRAGVRGGLVEVYPAVALHRWFPDHRYRYKGRVGGKSELAALAEVLLKRSWLTFEGGSKTRDVYARNHDDLDALIASLVARAHAMGLCEAIPAEHRREAELEGWIALPKVGSLNALPQD